MAYNGCAIQVVIPLWWVRAEPFLIGAMETTSFESTTVANADPAELVRRFNALHARPPYRLGNGDATRDAVAIARGCTRFSVELLLVLVRHGAFYETAANPHLSATQLDFLLGRLATAGSGSAQRLRYGFAIAARRNAFQPSDAVLHRLYDAVEWFRSDNTRNADGVAELQHMLDAVMHVRFAGGDAEAQRKAVLDVYIADDEEARSNHQRFDHAGVIAAQHPLASTEQLLAMSREYPNPEFARAVFEAMSARPKHLANPELRRFVADELGTYIDVATFLCRHPDPADFEASYEVLLSVPKSNEVLETLASDLSPEALAPLGRDILARLLESPVRAVRTLAVTALGSSYRHEQPGTPTKESSRISRR